VKTLCLAGPTASGKSALVLQAAKQLRGEAEIEVVSVDSAQVYRGMDIGTAKPSAEERAELAHHLIDIVEPEQAYSAARFIEDATRLVQQIRARGRLPLLVGGTMLYFKALRDGLHGMPGADAALRSELDRRAASEGWPALHAELACVDAPTAARLAPNDAQRIQRALEVWLLSGKPLSAWQAETPLARSDRWTLLSLEPSSREWLHRRIETRFDAMLDAGLVDEVRGLRRRPGLSAELPSMRSVGYRQAWAALDNDDLPGLRERGIAATRQLAKRQLTWLRSLPVDTRIACDAPHAAEHLLEALRRDARGS
jgi:tRNA dimethylallyltransferase